jgi:hypothetical protein
MTKKQEYIGAFLDGYFLDKKIEFGMQYYSMLNNVIDIAEKKWKQYKKTKAMTAEQYILENFEVNHADKDIQKAMIEFAKYHVEQALKKAAQEAELTVYKKSIYSKKPRWKKLKKEENEVDLTCYEVQHKVCKKSIQKAYSLKNIK